ncbi:MAG: nucleotidyltransferase family protein [Clostridia bacterium]|nr:nucleotidyltransferase family protein [Clostridia bacterium]
MENQWKNLLIMLNNLVHPEKKIELVQPVDWSRLINLARRHKVMPLVIELACEYSDFVDSDYGKVCVADAVSLTANQISKTAAFVDIYRKMSEDGITPIVMKGVICSELYGDYSDHRLSGDEDILIKKTDFNRVDEFLKNNGFNADFDNVTELQIRKIQEVTYTCDELNLRLEVHLNPLGTENDLRLKMNEWFDDCFENCRDFKVNGVTLKTFNHTDHCLFLIFHAAKHFTFGGFGIRQVLDILLYIEKYHSEIDFDYVKKALESVSAYLLYNDILCIGNEYLGFETFKPELKNCPEELLEDLMECGIYGDGTQAQRTAAQMVSAAVGRRRYSAKFGKAGLIFDTVFPDRRQFMSVCPEIEEKPWLIVRENSKRIARFISHRKANNNHLVVESTDIGIKRIKLLQKYGLI